MRRTRVIVLGFAVVLILAGVYLLKPGHAPEGQPALVTLDTQTLVALQADFNQMAANHRVILLLSPT